MRGLFCLAIVELLCVGTVKSQDWSTGFSLGWYWPRKADLRLVQPSRGTDLTLHGVGFRGRSLDTPLYYTLLIRRYLRRSGVAVEIEFTHAKAYAREDETVRASGWWWGQKVEGDVPFRHYIQSFSLSHGHNLLMANVCLGIVRSGLVRLAWKLGLGVAVPHVENRVEGHWVQRYQLAGICYQAGLTLGYQIDSSWQVNGCLRWSWSKLSGMKAYRGSLETELRGLHLDVGVLRLP